MNKRYRFFYLRNSYEQGKKGAPVGCVAITLENGGIAYQVSTLNPSDDFDRRVARDLALGRLVNSPIIIRGPVGQSMANITAVVMNDIVERHNLPMRTRKAAHHWFNTPMSSSNEVKNDSF